MDPDRRRELARMGGVAGHLSGTAHEFTSDEARQAGQKGGKAISRNRDHMVEIGRRGGKSRARHDAVQRAKTKSPQV
jgi:general stress protein YciG